MLEKDHFGCVDWGRNRTGGLRGQLGGCCGDSVTDESDLDHRNCVGLGEVF